jgi:hypothetical protein
MKKGTILVTLAGICFSAASFAQVKRSGAYPVNDDVKFERRAERSLYSYPWVLSKYALTDNSLMNAPLNYNTAAIKMGNSSMKDNLVPAEIKKAFRKTKLPVYF